MSQVQELLSKLHTLLKTINEYNLASQKMVKAEKNLMASTLHSSRLRDFDSIHMEQFIEEKIGPPPTEPNGLIKLLIPVYLIQKSQYDSAHATYDKIRPLAESAYREAFYSEREALRIQDEEEENTKLKEARKALDAAEAKVKEIKQKLDSDSTINSSLKKKEIIEKLILYLEEGRAESLKEAINLFYDEKRKDEEALKTEKHRKEMLALEEEKVRAAQAAEEYQRMQYEEAQQAAVYAQQAAFAAQDAAEQAKNNHFYEET